MDQPTKQNNPFNRVPSFDVSQLDKVNAIPNKTTDNALLDGLPQEDQLYLNALIEDDSSQDEEVRANRGPRSAWSPMAQSPIINKRIRKLRPAYAITLSLEDISYIRPSWGISKGIKTIEMNRQKKKVKPEVIEKKVEKRDAKSEGKKKSERMYQYCLVLLTIAVLLLMVPTYIIDGQRKANRIYENRMRVTPKSRLIEIYRPTGESLETVQKIEFAQGIPRDLKFDQCECEIFQTESEKYSREVSERNSTCVTSLDWPFRANLRIHMQKRQDIPDSRCYKVKWQSYDSLATPLIDCFSIGEEQWYGLGDTMEPIWPIGKHQSDWTPLVTNLTSEFPNPATDLTGQLLPLGSYVKFQLFSTNGIYIGKLKSDFSLSLRLSHDSKSGRKKICLSAVCADTCAKTWTREKHYDQFRYHNGFLEYTICSASSSKIHIAEQIRLSTEVLAAETELLSKIEDDKPKNTNETTGLIASAKSPMAQQQQQQQKMVDKTMRLDQVEPIPMPTPAPYTGLPDGIGLIERTIFATSREFLPKLDGKTLRQQVDQIVKLGLKTKPILLIDSRWQTYVGSLKLNNQAFPKAKLLFEILHNKGFKIILQIKPYIDTAIGFGSINQMFAAGKLYGTTYETKVMKPEKLSRVMRRVEVVRRRSLFKFENESVELNIATSTHPLMFKCKESPEGYCSLTDLSEPKASDWLMDGIKKSALLTQEADAIILSGSHPTMTSWDDHYKNGLSKLTKALFYDEKIFTISQWTGDLGYIQLAPRSFTWDSMRSLIGSVINVGCMGISLVHPGSVWGDIATPNDILNQSSIGSSSVAANGLDSNYNDAQINEQRNDEELAIRWLQVGVFLPIVQFNNLIPIQKYNLQDMLQNLMRIRKLFIVPEIKKHLPFTPLISGSKIQSDNQKLPVVRQVWYNQAQGETIIPEEFMIGPDILVAPILIEGGRQKDIYLPNGFWHDELRQVKIRGGKWLRNYPIELNEIAWFSRTNR